MSDESGLVWVSITYVPDVYREDVSKRMALGLIKARAIQYVQERPANSPPPIDYKEGIDPIREAFKGGIKHVWEIEMDTEVFDNCDIPSKFWRTPGIHLYPLWITGNYETALAEGRTGKDYYFGIEILVEQASASSPSLETHANDGGDAELDATTINMATPPSPASEAEIRRATEEYLATVTEPPPSERNMAAAIRKHHLNGFASRDRVIAVIKELSGTRRPGPR